MENSIERPTKLFNKNFTLQLIGQTVSRFGDQVFQVGMLLWIMQATGSASLMGILYALSSLPAVFLSPIGGTLADRFSRRKIIIFSDLLRGISVLFLAGILIFAPHATKLILVGLFVVSFFIATVSSFFFPAIAAAIPDLVPTERVATANSLGQLSNQGTVFLGLGMGGVFFRILGAPLIFLLNGLSYIFASVCEVFVQIPQVIPDKKGEWKDEYKVFITDLKEGLRFVWHRTGLREMVFVSAFLSFFTAPVTILLPFYVKDVLKVQIDWYGYISAAFGVGIVLGYIIAGIIKLSPSSRRNWMIIFIISNAAGYALLGLVNNAWLAMGLAFLGGLTGGFITINITTILQISTPSEIRGRVFGLLAAISASLAPISAGLAGIIADLVNKNIPLIYISCGLIMTVLTILIALNKDFRSFLAYDQPVQPPGQVMEPAILE